MKILMFIYAEGGESTIISTQEGEVTNEDVKSFDSSIKEFFKGWLIDDVQIEYEELWGDEDDGRDPTGE